MALRRLLCAGAAKGLVAALESTFTAETGATLDGTFGAVGALREKLLAGAPCDVDHLTAPLIDDARSTTGASCPAARAPLGTVRTGIAVRAGEPLPDIRRRRALRATLVRARGCCFPIRSARRPASTSSTCCAASAFATRSPHASRRFRMARRRCARSRNRARQAQSAARRSPRSTYTPGVVLVGALPPGFDLATVYTAAVCAAARDRALAQRLRAMLGGAQIARRFAPAAVSNSE